jgi:hypothetical protein
MKINNEQLHAVQESRTQRPATQLADRGFDRLLIREMDGGPARETDSSGRIALPVHLRLSPGLEAGEVSGAGGDIPAFPEEAADMVDNVLTELEGYAAQLGRDEAADLRSAFASLRSAQDGINGFRARFPGVSGGAAEELINELDVLATTENFKFNRGDYL